MATDIKKDTPEPVAVTEQGTDLIVRTGDSANKAVRVNVVAGLGPSGGPSAAFDAAFPASGYASGAKATAAAPTYGEGNMVALSVDLAGNLRTGGGGGGLTDTQLRATPVPVSVSGAATAAKQDTGNTSLASIDTKLTNPLPVSGTFYQATQPVSAAALPLPAGASTEATLALIKTDVDKIPASPSQEHATAASPHSVELSDGAAFYTAAKTGQLPGALDGSGFLKTHEQGVADVTPAKATAATPSYIEASKNPLSVDLSGNLRVVSVGGTTYFPLTESSTYDGVAATLTLGHTPTDEPRVFVGGMRWYPGVNYSRAGAVLTWITLPTLGETIQVDYTWSMASSTLNSTLVVDVSGNVQPTGDAAARSIHVTVDASVLPAGAALDANLSNLAQEASLRRSHERLYLETMEQDFRLMAGSESYAANRAGMEIR